jgi:biopolymer transport protein TolR
MAAKLGSKGPMADMNVTPLIDVVLVLLVVFMVITPMLTSGQAVDLPEATQTTSVNDAGQFIVVSITQDRGWWVEQDQVEPDGLIDRINEEFHDKPTYLDEDGNELARNILIKADRRLEYSKVREAMDLLADKGMTSVLVAANKEK